MAAVLEVPRGLGALLGAEQRALGTGVGYVDLGFVYPLSVPPAGVVTAPLFVSGLSSYNLFANVAVAIADSVNVDLLILRPDQSAWPAFNVGNFSVNVAGVQQVNFGSRGRDTNAISLLLNFCAFWFALKLSTTGGGTATLSDVTLACQERI
jgi:hypothetical protein